MANLEARLRRAEARARPAIEARERERLRQWLARLHATGTGATLEEGLRFVNEWTDLRWLQAQVECPPVETPDGRIDFGPSVRRYAELIGEDHGKVTAHSRRFFEELKSSAPEMASLMIVSDEYEQRPGPGKRRS